MGNMSSKNESSNHEDEEAKNESENKHKYVNKATDHLSLSDLAHININDLFLEDAIHASEIAEQYEKDASVQEKEKGKEKEKQKNDEKTKEDEKNQKDQKDQKDEQNEQDEKADKFYSFILNNRVQDNVQMDTLILADYDDTLLPSSHLASLKYTLTTRPEDMDAEFLEKLSQLDKELVEYFILLMSLGTIHIVTNGEAGWVELSSARFLPSFFAFLTNYGVHVTSARTLYQCLYPEKIEQWKCEAFQVILLEHYFGVQCTPPLQDEMIDEFQNVFTFEEEKKEHTKEKEKEKKKRKPKANGRQKEKEKEPSNENVVTLPSAYKEKEKAQEKEKEKEKAQEKEKEKEKEKAQEKEKEKERKRMLIKNVISFGDSLLEKNAIDMVAKQFLNVYTKTIKLLERPNVSVLRMQIQTLTREFRHIQQYAGDLFLVLEPK